MKPNQSQLTFTVLTFAIISLIALFTLTSKSDFGEKTPSSFDQLGGDFTLQSSQVKAVSLLMKWMRII